MKLVLRLSTGVGFLFLVALVSSLIINAFDDAQDAQVELAESSLRTPQKTEGGTILVGLFLNSPTWKEDAAEIISGRKTLDSSTPYLSVPESYETILLRYEMLLETTDYQNPYPPSYLSQMKISPWMGFIRHHHEQLSLKNDRIQLQQLLKEAQLFRRMLDGNIPLIYALIHVVWLRDNLEMIESLVKKNLSADALEPFKNFDIVKTLQKIAPYEIAVSSSYIDLIDSQKLKWSEFKDLENYFHLFLRPGETKNLIAKHWNFIIANSCWTTPLPDLCTKGDEAIANSSPWLSIKNQAGATLVRILAENGTTRFVKLADQMDLISRKADLLK